MGKPLPPKERTYYWMIASGDGPHLMTPHLDPSEYDEPLDVGFETEADACGWLIKAVLDGNVTRKEVATFILVAETLSPCGYYKDIFSRRRAEAKLDG